MKDDPVLLSLDNPEGFKLEELARILGQEIAIKSAKLEGLKEGLPLESRNSLHSRRYSRKTETYCP